MNKNLYCTLFSAAILSSGSQLYAQQSPAPEAKIWKGNVDFGYVDTSGNTNESSIKSSARINREKDQWRYSITWDSLSSESDGDRSAEKYFLANRLAYQFSKNNYAFGYASYDDDRFSGFDYQATVALGYGRRILNEETMHWDLEVGPGYRESKVDNSTTGKDSEEMILRLFTQFDWAFSDNAHFSEEFNVESGSDNTISKSITSLKVNIIGSVALKLSYTIKYSEEVPTGTKHADKETAVTLSYTF